MRHIDDTRKFDATTHKRSTRPPMLTLCMPAMPPLGLMASIENRLRAWRQRHHHQAH